MRYHVSHFAPLRIMSFSRRGVERIHGYSAIGREILENKDIVEFKESFDVHSLDKHQLLGQKMFDGAIQSLSHQTVILAQRLLQCLAKDLGVQPRDMLQSHSNMFDPSNATSLRLLHYPPIDLKSSEHQSITRCGEHSDYGGLTLLFQVNGMIRAQKKCKKSTFSDQF